MASVGRAVLLLLAALLAERVAHAAMAVKLVHGLCSWVQTSTYGTLKSPLRETFPDMQMS